MYSSQVDPSEREDAIAESPTPEYKATEARDVSWRKSVSRSSVVREARSSELLNSRMIHTLHLRRSNVGSLPRKLWQTVMN